MKEQLRLKGLLAKQEALRQVTQAMARQVELDIQPLFEEALAHLAQAVEAPMACLHLADEEAQTLSLVAGHRLDPVWARAWARLRLAGSAVPARVKRESQALELVGTQAPAGLEAVSCAPVMGAQVTVGTLTLLWPTPQRPPDDPDRQGFLDVAGHLLGLSMEHAGLVSELMSNLEQVRQLQQAEERRNRELADLNETLRLVNAQLAELSLTDALTGLANRRHLMDRLAQEVQRARRLGQPLSLLMADLDHFKRVNDQLGHQAGDRALREFAAMVRGSVREVDLVGRYGGEEFAVLLLDCALDAALMVAGKIRRTVKQGLKHSPFDSLGGLTVSLGAAQLLDGMGPEDFLAQADRALYMAKANGRDRVEPQAPPSS